MKVSFGIINYNRLFYLKSCAESLMESVKDYPDVEFICIDDNSKEPGTQEYLQSLKDRGWIVVNQENYRKLTKKSINAIKDVIDEFSSALNLFYQLSSGELLAPLQGDLQFIRKGWLKEYVDLFSGRNDVFAIMFDAQRRTRLEGSTFEKVDSGSGVFAVEKGRGIPGAGDCLYNREVLNALGGWHVGLQHNAEEIFTEMGGSVFNNSKKVYVPWSPPAAVIFTDPRGTNGRVRGNKRFGLYWEALKDNRYYQWIEKDSIPHNNNRPASIEEVVVANGGWELPIDENGNWKKNPINWPAEQENVACEVIY